MNEAATNLVKELSKSFLDDWEAEPDLEGLYLVTLVASGSVEVEVRKGGTVPDFTTEEFRENLFGAMEKKEQGFSCRPEGLGYPLLYQEELLGVCILFPTSEVQPLSRWEEKVGAFSLQLGPLFSSSPDEPPSLNSLAGAIPERVDPGEEPARKLHWERSQTRVEMPVEEELATYLLLDHNPLF